MTQVAASQDRAGRYELIIDAQNAASVRVAEKCGYRFVGTRRSVVENTGESYEDLIYLPSSILDSCPAGSIEVTRRP